MSRGTTDERTRAQGFPRVSGDEPWIAKTERIISAFSPRERG